MVETMHLALIGDLVASRKQPDRAAGQESLISALETVRQRVRWAAPITLTAGDEVQGLLATEGAETALQAMTLLSEALVDTRTGARTGVGLQIRFGLGMGALSTPPVDPERLRETSPAMLDGPCFHRARAALDRARHEGRWACVSGFSSGLDEEGTDEKALNALLALMGHVRARWTVRQLEYIREWRDEVDHRIAASVEDRRAGKPPRIYRERIDDAVVRRLARGSKSAVAEAMNRSPSVITQAFQAAAFEELRDAEEAVRLMLRRCGDAQEQAART